jgi:Ca2+-binding EF-hand superfamily protein
MGNKGGKAKVGKPAKLSSKDEKFLVGKTGLSKNDVEAVFARFNANNPDGLLNRDEFSRLYQSLRNEPVNNLDEIQNMVFRAFDSDNNGSLTFSEFLIGYAFTSKGDQKTKLDYAFELYDADNNGWLSQAELKEVLSCMLDLLSSDKSQVSSLVSEIATQLDQGGDGKVSKGIVSLLSIF